MYPACPTDWYRQTSGASFVWVESIFKENFNADNVKIDAALSKKQINLVFT